MTDWNVFEECRHAEPKPVQQLAGSDLQRRMRCRVTLMSTRRHCLEDRFLPSSDDLGRKPAGVSNELRESPHHQRISAHAIAVISAASIIDSERGFSATVSPSTSQSPEMLESFSYRQLYTIGSLRKPKDTPSRTVCSLLVFQA